MRELKKINMARRRAELNLKEIVVRITQLGSAMFSQLNKSEPRQVKFMHTYKKKLQEAQDQINTIKENLAKIDEHFEKQQKEKKWQTNDQETPFRNRR